MQSTTIVPGASLLITRDGKCRVDKRGRPLWDMPKPKHYAPHWINPKLKADALAKGLDLMTAGVGFAIHVPVYRGVANSVYKVMKNTARRKAMGRYVW